MCCYVAAVRVHQFTDGRSRRGETSVEVSDLTAKCCYGPGGVRFGFGRDTPSASRRAVRPSGRQLVRLYRDGGVLPASSRPRCSPWNYRVLPWNSVLCAHRRSRSTIEYPRCGRGRLQRASERVCAGANSEQGCRVARSHHRRTRSGRTQPPLASALHRESRQARSEQHTSMAPTRERDLRAACPRAERSIPSARLLLGRSLSLSLSLSLSAHTPSCVLPVRSVACM